MKEIVIKISDREYELLQRVAKTERGLENLSEYGELILKGTLLPKGHGDLKDVSELLTVTDIREDGSEVTYVSYDDIENAEAIIEADTESEEV